MRSARLPLSIRRAPRETDWAECLVPHEPRRLSGHPLDVPVHVGPPPGRVGTRVPRIGNGYQRALLWPISRPERQPIRWARIGLALGGPTSCPRGGLARKRFRPRGRSKARSCGALPYLSRAPARHRTVREGTRRAFAARAVASKSCSAAAALSWPIRKTLVGRAFNKSIGISVACGP